jgi:hypothetical protein
MCGLTMIQNRCLLSVMLARSEAATTAMTRYLESGALLNPDASILLLFESCFGMEVDWKGKGRSYSNMTECHFPTKRAQANPT